MVAPRARSGNRLCCVQVCFGVPAVPGRVCPAWRGLACGGRGKAERREPNKTMTKNNDGGKRIIGRGRI